MIRWLALATFWVVTVATVALFDWVTSLVIGGMGSLEWYRGVASGSALVLLIVKDDLWGSVGL